MQLLNLPQKFLKKFGHLLQFVVSKKRADGKDDGLWQVVPTCRLVESKVTAVYSFMHQSHFDIHSWLNAQGSPKASDKGRHTLDQAGCCYAKKTPPTNSHRGIILAIISRPFRAETFM